MVTGAAPQDHFSLQCRGGVVIPPLDQTYISQGAQRPRLADQAQALHQDVLPRLRIDEADRTVLHLEAVDGCAGHRPMRERLDLPVLDRRGEVRQYRVIPDPRRMTSLGRTPLPSASAV